MLQDVTFGITAFERPTYLEQLVSSILLRYPRANIIVADNGRRKARLPKQVKVLNLPFDCGLSRARNALADQLKTKYLLVLEEDFLFTNETRIEHLVEVLESDEEVGVVGGALRSRNGRVSAYALDIEIFRDTFYVRESNHRVRITPRGTPYRICDVIWNFALFRADLLRDHRWDNELKVGEHAPYFHQIKLEAKWRVASCPSAILYHVPDPRTPEYQRYRQRAQKMFRQYLKRHNLARYIRIPPVQYIDDRELKPSVVVIGVGHSGTSILAKMLHAAGWDPGDADRPYGESFAIRDINMETQKTGLFPEEKARAVLARLPRPFAIKDPRFAMTLHHWLPLFLEMESPPALVRIQRDPDEVEKSYARRNVRGDLRNMIQQRTEMCQKQYENWPWMRMTIEYEQLGQAAALFDQARMKTPGAQASPGALSTRSAPKQADQLERDSQVFGLQADSIAVQNRASSLESQAYEMGFGLELDSQVLGANAEPLQMESQAYEMGFGPELDSHVFALEDGSGILSNLMQSAFRDLDSHASDEELAPQDRGLANDSPEFS